LNASASQWGLASGVLDLACGDPGDHDGGADHVGASHLGDL